MSPKVDLAIERQFEDVIVTYYRAIYSCFQVLVAISTHRRAASFRTAMISLTGRETKEALRLHRQDHLLTTPQEMVWRIF